MSGFLLTLHVIVSILLVAVILLQPGAKGGGLGASFGGGGANSAFGARAPPRSWPSSPTTWPPASWPRPW